MDNKAFPKWLDRYPILDADDENHLNTVSALNEFHKKIPRHQAEAEAHEEYVKDKLHEAAAHHLRGIKSAHAVGDTDTATKHGAMYVLLCKRLGHDPIGEVPPEISNKMKSQPSKSNSFKPHSADAFVLPNKKEKKDES